LLLLALTQFAERSSLRADVDAAARSAHNAAETLAASDAAVMADAAAEEAACAAEADARRRLAAVRGATLAACTRARCGALTGRRPRGCSARQRMTWTPPCSTERRSRPGCAAHAVVVAQTIIAEPAPAFKCFAGAVGACRRGSPGRGRGRGGGRAGGCA
jgi:hypothetical protein